MKGVEDIIIGGGPFLRDVQSRVISLSIKVDGLSLYLTGDVASYAFMVFRIQSLMLHDHILRDTRIYGIDFDFKRVLDGLSVVVKFGP